MATALPRWLIKYLKPQHLEGALNDGKFRVGSLHEYQDAERYQGQQHDPGEGTMMQNGVIDGWSRDKGHPTIPIIQQMFGGMPSKMNRVVFLKCRGSVPDCNILCTSHKFNPDVYSRYGAAVLITDVDRFWSAMTHALIACGRTPNGCETCAREIAYRDREAKYTYWAGKMDTTDDVPWEFVKPKSFEEDHEWRFAWPTLSLPAPDERVITCPEAARYCELFDPVVRRRWPKTSRLKARRGQRRRSSKGIILPKTPRNASGVEFGRRTPM